MTNKQILLILILIALAVYYLNNQIPAKPVRSIPIKPAHSQLIKPAHSRQPDLQTNLFTINQPLQPDLPTINPYLTKQVSFDLPTPVSPTIQPFDPLSIINCPAAEAVLDTSQ